MEHGVLNDWADEAARWTETSLQIASETLLQITVAEVSETGEIKLIFLFDKIL